MATATHTAGADKEQAAEASHKRKREIADAEEIVERKYGLDLDILDRPICLEPFSPPVYQCHNGLTACSACCKKVMGKGCPTCALPTGSIRFMGIGKILESSVLSCKCARHGCEEMQGPTYIEEHETDCDYEPFRCPVAECIFKGP